MMLIYKKIISKEDQGNYLFPCKLGKYEQKKRINGHGNKYDILCEGKKCGFCKAKSHLKSWVQFAGGVSNHIDKSNPAAKVILQFQKAFYSVSCTLYNVPVKQTMLPLRQKVFEWMNNCSKCRDKVSLYSQFSQLREGTSRDLQKWVLDLCFST